MTAPTSLWDLSTTPASNTSVQGNSVAENCAPSGINDAIRALAAMNKGALIAVSSAGTDTYTATLAPAPDALVTGMGVYIKFGNANALSSSTLAVNGLTAKTIKKNGATAILAGDIPAGHMGALYYDGTNWILQNPAMTKQPTRQVKTTGSGTYNTPDGCTRINVRMLGGGGGGGAQATNTGSTGGDTTFSTLTASAGLGGVAAGGAGGVGGAASGGDINLVGGKGQGGFFTSVASVDPAGGQGASGPFGGSGGGGNVNTGGVSASVNSGSGGGGSGGASATSSAGGGGAGGYVEKLITAPAATYSYGVGAKGNGGVAGTLGGGDGGSGLIIVDEYYN